MKAACTCRTAGRSPQDQRPCPCRSPPARLQRGRGNDQAALACPGTPGKAVPLSRTRGNADPHRPSHPCQAEAAGSVARAGRGHPAKADHTSSGMHRGSPLQADGQERRSLPSRCGSRDRPTRRLPLPHAVAAVPVAVVAGTSKRRDPPAHLPHALLPVSGTRLSTAVVSGLRTVHRRSTGCRTHPSGAADRRCGYQRNRCPWLNTLLADIVQKLADATDYFATDTRCRSRHKTSIFPNCALRKVSKIERFRCSTRQQRQNRHHATRR